MIAVIATLLLGAMAPPITLQNAAIRVEVEPQVMAVRFVGAPEGPNMVEALHVEHRDARLHDWVDAGGVTWDLSPGATEDAALRRGPAEVLIQSPSRLVLLSPPSATSPLRMKLELTLHGNEAAVHMESVVTTESTLDFFPLSVRCAFRLRPGALVGSYDSRLPVVAALDQAGSAPAPVSQWDGVLMDAGAAGTAPLVASALGSSALIQRAAWVLTREVDGGAAEASAYASARNLHAVQDTRSHAYGLIMESPRVQVDLDTPLVYREVWRLSTAD